MITADDKLALISMVVKAGMNEVDTEYGCPAFVLTVIDSIAKYEPEVVDGKVFGLDALDDELTEFF